MKLINFTRDDIFFMIIIFILYFFTNFNLIEGKQGKKKKQKAKVKKLEKKERKGKLNPKQQEKLAKLRGKIEARKKRKLAKREARRKRREEKKARKEEAERQKALLKDLERNMDEDDINRHIFNSDILTRLQESKEKELRAERSDIMKSMTTKNYWELIYGDVDSWKKKYLGKPGVEEQVERNDDFDPFSFMLSLNSMAADFTSYSAADLIPDTPIVSTGTPDKDWITGKPLPDGPALPSATSI